MKLIVDDYEVEIKVKRVGATRANKETTSYFLNNMACRFFNAADSLERLGCIYSAKQCREDAGAIHAFLDSIHFYDDVRNKIK